jgi:serine/threonine protein phosphatase PrpC
MTILASRPFIVRQATDTTTDLQGLTWDGCLHSQRSPGKASCNEDAALIFPLGERGVVAAVADGCGGMQAGEQASRIAVHALARSLRHSSWDSRRTLRAAILDGIDQANERILRLGVGAASTLAVVTLLDNYLCSYHVGDSMVLISQRQRTRYRSICHSPVGYAIESGWLGPRRAMSHQDRHLVSNYLGYRSMRIEIGPALSVSVNDRITLASDGLFDNLLTDEVVQRVASSSPSDGVKKLRRLAIRRMLGDFQTIPSKPDDLTIISLRPGP